MKRFRLNALAWAALVTLATSSQAQDCSTCMYPGPPVVDVTPQVTMFTNTPLQITVDKPFHMEAIGSGENFQGLQQVYDEPTGWFADFVNKYLFGGMRDMGDWYCKTCSGCPPI